MGQYQAGLGDISGSVTGGEFKSFPKGTPQQAFNHATAPATATVQKNPAHVLVNTSGSYYFLYESTSSIGSITHEENYILGLSTDNIRQGPIRLDINPVAWSGSGHATTGNVTFVYQGR